MVSAIPPEPSEASANGGGVDAAGARTVAARSLALDCALLLASGGTLPDEPPIAAAATLPDEDPELLAPAAARLLAPPEPEPPPVIPVTPWATALPAPVMARPVPIARPAAPARLPTPVVAPPEMIAWAYFGALSASMRTTRIPSARPAIWSRPGRA